MVSTQETTSLGYVLHRRPYRENSLILEVFSEEQGRLSLVARKRSGSKAASPIAYESFRRLRLQWRGRGDLKTLTRLEQAGRYALGRSQMAFGMYVNELLVRLVPRFEHSMSLFTAYEGLLAQLAAGEPQWQAVTRFEVELLMEMGYGLDADEGAHPHLLESGLGHGVSARLTAAASRALETGDYSDPQGLQDLRGFLDALFQHYAGGRRLHARALLPALTC